VNGWDIFTYFCCVLLAGSAVAIFVFFLRDARELISGLGEEKPDEE
jgi:hypothetical protein